ncbi:hypothetical protein SLEP1_g33336 [Rubroshorea leprosula]|uniref:Uncharacterized protein n=1 Tax=Rubroshorea leprosula TaxID=152421 RepID=A0AAV5KGG2_9ROSI|nr:hypothetical protein SLEP1_g33336 [Rubroshorea leprosula]
MATDFKGPGEGRFQGLEVVWEVRDQFVEVRNGKGVAVLYLDTAMATGGGTTKAAEW